MVQHFPGSPTFNLPSVLTESGAYSPDRACQGPFARAAAPYQAFRDNASCLLGDLLSKGAKSVQDTHRVDTALNQPKLHLPERPPTRIYTKTNFRRKNERYNCHLISSSGYLLKQDLSARSKTLADFCCHDAALYVRPAYNKNRHRLRLRILFLNVDTLSK